MKIGTKMKMDSSRRSFWLVVLLGIIGYLIVCAMAMHAQANRDRDFLLWGGTAGVASASPQSFIDYQGTATDQFEVVASGTAASTQTVTVATCMPGGNCSGTLATSSAVGSYNLTAVSSLGPANTWKVTVTWTGGDATTAFRVNRIGIPGAGSTIATMSGQAPATAPGGTLIIGGQFNTVQPSPTNGQTVAFQSDATGAILTSTRTTQSDACLNPNSTFSSVALNASGTTAVQIVALAAGKKIYVCSFTVIGGGTTPTFSLVYGTGSNCGTGTTTLMGAIPLSTSIPFASGYNLGVTASANALCTLLAGTTPTAVGILSFAQ